MKKRLLFLLLLPLASHAQFSMDSLKKAGNDILQSESGKAMQAQLLEQIAPGGQLDLDKAEAVAVSVMGPGPASDTVKQLVKALKSDDFASAVALFRTAKKLKLSPEQAELWNLLKAEAASFVVKGEFDYENSALRPQLDSIVSALRAGDKKGLGQAVSKFTRATQLTPEQLSLLVGVRETAAPIVAKASTSLGLPTGG